jgi:hypothetical protein
MNYKGSSVLYLTRIQYEKRGIKFTILFQKNIHYLTHMYESLPFLFNF